MTITNSQNQSEIEILESEIDASTHPNNYVEPKGIMPTLAINPPADVLSALISEAVDSLLAEKNIQALAISRLAHMDSIGQLVKQNAQLVEVVLTIAEKIELKTPVEMVRNGEAITEMLAIKSNMQFDINKIMHIAYSLIKAFHSIKSDIASKSQDIFRLQSDIDALKKNNIELTQALSKEQRKKYSSFSDMPFFLFNSETKTYIGFDKVEKKSIEVSNFNQAKRYTDAAESAQKLFKLIERNKIPNIKNYRIVRLRISGEDAELSEQTLAALADARK